MNLTATQQQLLACLRPNQLDEQTAEMLRGLSAEKWRTLCNLAADHHIPFTWIKRLRQHQLFTTLPTDLQNELDNHYKRQTWRNLRTYNVLGDILRALGDDSKHVLLLKGVHLANFVYEEMSMRVMGDIDILVQKQQLPRIEQILLNKGYTLSETARNFPYHWGFAPPAPNLPPVELHWHVKQPDHPLFIADDLIWQHTTTATILGHTVQLMSPELLICYLCWHAVHHRWEVGIKTVVDVSAIVAHHTLDWKRVVKLAAQIGVSKHLAVTLALIEQSLLIEIPQTILQQLVPSGISDRLLSAAAHYLLTTMLTEREAKLSIEFATLWEGGSFNFAVLWQGLFLPRHKLGEMYDVLPQSWRIYLCYPQHAFNLLREHWRTVWRILVGDPALKTEIELVETFLSLASCLPQNNA